jgi:cytochrome c oxidase subunit 3
MAVAAPPATRDVPRTTPKTPAAPLTPGKVAMWVFLGTEVMFFTGLIGSYIVLRAGSSPLSYSNIFSPETPLKGKSGYQGIRIINPGSNQEAVLHLFQEASGFDHHHAEHLLHGPYALIPGMPPEKAQEFARKLEQAGAQVELESLKTYDWPLPYDHATNPLSIDLTAVNTFFLICSSVTMVLALAACQRGNQKMTKLYLLATVLIGSLFVSIQVYEYYMLAQGHVMPIGISHDGHFRPGSSLFASCFYIMTSFHGMHVTAGVILLFCIWVQAMRGKYSATKYHSIENAGLYWHFVDLVWIILFTVVYLI